MSIVSTRDKQIRCESCLVRALTQELFSADNRAPRRARGSHRYGLPSVGTVRLSKRLDHMRPDVHGTWYTHSWTPYLCWMDYSTPHSVICITIPHAACCTMTWRYRVGRPTIFESAARAILYCSFRCSALCTCMIAAVRVRLR